MWRIGGDAAAQGGDLSGGYFTDDRIRGSVTSFGEILTSVFYAAVCVVASMKRQIMTFSRLKVIGLEAIAFCD